MQKITSLLILCFVFISALHSQIVDPFAIRFQTNLKGGMVFLANTSIGCNCSANSEMPPGGSSDNNGFSMTYVDIDSDASTFMSNSDQLNLPNCSEVVWAGLYWVGMLADNASSTPNYTVRNNVRLSANNGAYINLVADETLDNTVGKVMYNCFKDVTSIVQANPIDATYRVANVVTQNGSNTFGGWTMVVVYRNIYESMKNLTVFDGLANVSAGAGTVNINLSGFLTPPSGPVSFELGVVAHDGDRGQTGDQLAFNGAGSFVQISDALHGANNAFNSTISRNGVLTPLRNPSYNNNLGHDANIYSPNNASLNYIGNSATTAQIRVSTQSETVLTSVITSAIDIYEPDLRASVSFTDLNGGAVQPGDVLEYSITAKNIGSDVSINTFLTDTLDERLQYIPGSISYTFGPNTGAKTDPADSDQAEFIAADNVIRARIGTGANGTTGGAVVNSPTGADSTVIKFRVRLHEDCAVWQCGTELQNKAYLFGTGQISGITNGNNGLSDLLDAEGCPSPESGLVNVNTQACAPFLLNYTDSVCVGETIQFNFPNSPNITYSWTGPNGFTSTIANPSIPNSELSDAGDYFLLVSYNGTTCVDDTIAPVFVSTNPTIDLVSLQNDVCYQGGDGSIEVLGVGNNPFTYAWSNGDADQTAEDLLAGTYTVTATDQYNCTASETYTITEPPIFTISAAVTSNYNGTQISCFGASDGSASATLTGGVAPISIEWVGMNDFDTEISNLPAGTYTVQATDQTGCIASATVTLSQPNELTISGVVTNVLCFGENTGAINTTITGGTQPYNILWQNSGSIVEDLTDLLAGDYTIDVTDVNGCAQTADFTVTQPAAGMNISATHTDLLCFEDSTSTLDLTVSGGVTPYSYAWVSGQNTEDLQNLPAGTYTVMVTDANNCPQDFTYSITEPGPLTGTFSNTNPVCQSGGQGSIDLIISGGTPTFTYLWNNNETTEDLSNLFAGDYEVFVQDVNGCSATFQTSLSDPDALTLSAVISDVLCYNGSSGIINITVGNGTLPYTFDWSNGTVNEDATNIPEGSYFVNVSDANGCGIFETFQVNQPDTLVYISTSNTTSLLCNGDSDASISIVVAGGTPAYTFAWTNAATTQNISNLSAGTYSVTVTDDNGCNVSQSFTITQPTSLQLAETHTDVLCFGEATAAIQVSTTGGTAPYTYLWNNGAQTEDLTSLPQGTYTLNVTDANGCTNQISITNSQPAAGISVSSTEEAVLCFGGSNGSIDLSISGGTPGYTVLWNTNQSSEDLLNLLAGTYSVVVTDDNGCTQTYSTTVTEPSGPLTLIGIESSICFGSTDGMAIVQASGGTPGYTYLWNTGSSDTNDTLTGLNTGTYTVVVTDQNGCFESVSVSVFQPDDLDGCVGLEMPNVFSPDNDDVNEFYLPIKALNIKEYNVQIVNRWGNLMYEGNDYTKGWDGTVNGNEATDGVYFYKVVYTDNYDRSGTLQGFVTLIRK
jgi:gliding motility-associated-like protein/uncharacterized repeat protein (TIGR01451 family)